jgi:hypothetical protein
MDVLFIPILFRLKSTWGYQNVATAATLSLAIESSRVRKPMAS